MTCPRCEATCTKKLTTSPVPDIWDVLQCQACLYTWRTTEPVRRTTRDAYPQEFRLTRADIEGATDVPAIPPRLRAGGSISV